MENIILRTPVAADAKKIHTLIRRSPPLEPNSGYAYLLMSIHFAQTSIVATNDNAMVGAVFGYRLPERPDTLFVWQIAVDPAARKTGLAVWMLKELAGPCIRFFEATVSRSNVASYRLFQKFADVQSCPFVCGKIFRGGLFPERGHDDEQLVRIGPMANGQREEDTACH